MEIEKTFSFAAGHRLSLHEGHCSNIHGHNYTAIIKVSADLTGYIGDIGYLIDFGELKKIVNDKFDHKFVMCVDDEYFESMKALSLPGLVGVDYQPTAENMATDIARSIKARIEEIAPSRNEITVILWETDTASATVKI